MTESDNDFEDMTEDEAIQALINMFCLVPAHKKHVKFKQEINDLNLGVTINYDLPISIIEGD